MMLAVSSQELQQIQQELSSAVCDQTCQLYAPVASSDTYGSNINTWPTLTATTVCGMRIPTGSELANYDFKIGDKAAYHVDFPVSTTLDEQWHVIVAAQTLEVNIILTPQSYPGLLQTICTQIKE